MAPPNLLALLHGTSPYEGHDLAAHPGDLQGWGSTHPIFEALLRAARPAIIVEVGTWKGASAIHMGRIARSLGLATQIVCVDTWLGSPEHFLGLGDGWRESLRLHNGYPQLYFTFLTNIIDTQLTDIVVPLPATSENAVSILHTKQVRPDFVYIDATHEYGAVKRDLYAYWSLLSDTGVLLGDDYAPAWPQVVRAANDFAREQNLRIADCRGKFLLSKRPLVLPQALIVPSAG